VSAATSYRDKQEDTYKGDKAMVTKKGGRTKKGRVKVSKLKLNKETVKSLSAGEKGKVKGGARPLGGDDTKVIGTCTIVVVCV